jgi:hypothetical protein
LAVIETGVAVLIYFVLATLYDMQSLLLTSVIAAPLLLLRSEEAVADSLTILRQGFSSLKMSFSNQTRSKPVPRIRQWGEIFILCFFVIVGPAILFCYLTNVLVVVKATPSERAARFFLLTNLFWMVSTTILHFLATILPYLSANLLNQRSRAVAITSCVIGTVVGAYFSSGFLWTLTTLGMCALVCGLSFSSLYYIGIRKAFIDRTRKELSKEEVSGLSTFPREPLSLFPELVLMTGILVSLYFSNLLRSPTWTEACVFISSLWAVAGLLAGFLARFSEMLRTDDAIDRVRLLFCVSGEITIWQTVGTAIGLILSGIIIRLYSTLKNLSSGFNALPNNWRDNLFVIDFLHPPEIHPRIGRISKTLTTTYQFGLLRDPNVFWLQKSTILLSLPARYLALMYRWSLKSTLWLWWPLIMLMTPNFQHLTEEQLRVRTSVTVRSSVARVKLTIALAVIVWLAHVQFPLIASSLKSVPGVSSLVNFMDSFTQPQIGIRWFMLMTVCLITIYMWFLGSKLAAAYEDALKAPDKHKALDGEARKIFQIRARLIERIRSAGIVCVIVLGYSSALHYAAQWYPSQVNHAVPSWLLSIL